MEEEEDLINLEKEMWSTVGNLTVAIIKELIPYEMMKDRNVVFLFSKGILKVGFVEDSSLLFSMDKEDIEDKIKQAVQDENYEYAKVLSNLKKDLGLN